ncbi:MAG: sulfate transporter CysZ [Methylococcaceae bacterium]|nr:sulfate transporter CysZ [Methylococcaceae bacterium]
MNSEFDKKAGLNPLLAVQSLLQGMSMLMRKELRKFVLIPILINFLLYSAMLSLGYVYIGALMAQFIPDWLQWLSWLIYPVFFMSFFIAGFFTFTLLANLIASPFYGGLSAKTQQIIRGDAVQIQEQALSKVLFSELKRIVYLLSRAIPIVIISVIPGLNLIAPVLWGLFGAWGLSMEYFAYPLENQGLLFKEQREALKTVRIGALSFGGIVLLVLAIPVLNIVMPPIAVISATIYRDKLIAK